MIQRPEIETERKHLHSPSHDIKFDIGAIKQQSAPDSTGFRFIYIQGAKGGVAHQNNGVTSSNNKLLPVKGEVRCNPSLPGPPSPCGQSVGPF